LVNRSPAANRRRVESEAVFELILSKFGDGEGKVLPGAGQIRETNRNELGALVRSIFQDSLRVHLISCKIKGVLGVLFAPARRLVRSNLACLTTLRKQSCGIEGLRVKNRDYNRKQIDVKGKTGFLCATSVCSVSLWLKVDE